MKKESKIAVILIRGIQGMNQDVKDTLRMMNILRRNACTIITNAPHHLGMINKIKNYITYGEVDEATLKVLKEKKGDSTVYNLNSPRKGYGRKGIKYTFSQGGALGYRGAQINDLIKRML